LIGRSTTTNLLKTLNDWTIALQDKKSVIAAYIDFSKAFDMVSHPKLLSKLKSYGINGNLLAWIQAFLSGRTQQTRVGHHLSPTSQILSGVVQVSVIGPLLFLLFINNLNEQLCEPGCKCKLYADHVKLYASFTLSDIDYNVIQNRLDAVHT
jgi:ribonuclease P/MRP protein subunit RPP40